MLENGKNGEMWKTIHGFSRYRIHVDGHVKRLAFTDTSGKFRKEQLITTKGSRLNMTPDKGKKQMVRIGRLMLLTFNRPPKKGECALHADDISAHNSLKNLYWGDKKQNHKDAVRNGRHGPGSVAAKTIGRKVKRYRALKKEFGL
jgi:hypothetical protein